MNYSGKKIILLTKKKNDPILLTRKKDNRSNSRVPFDSKLIVNSSCLNGGISSGWSLNISSGGMRIMVDKKLSVGEIVSMRVEKIKKWRQFRGRVVWVKHTLDGCIAGISFYKKNN